MDTIPNPLTDKGVVEDIHRKVEEILNSPSRIGTLDSIIKNAVERAAKWGYSEGFRMGWKVYEVRNKRQT